MSTDALNRLEELVMSLPRAERARLAERIIVSLDTDSDVEEAWAAEIRRRIDQIDRGEIELIPANEVIEEAQRLIRG
jgi:putative addiction module component (TIGR02574 family)